MSRYTVLLYPAEAGGFHARTADAHEAQRRHVLAQCADELTAEQIARRFAGYDAYSARSR